MSERFYHPADPVENYVPGETYWFIRRNWDLAKMEPVAETKRQEDRPNDKKDIDAIPLFELSISNIKEADMRAPFFTLARGTIREVSHDSKQPYLLVDFEDSSSTRYTFGKSDSSTTYEQGFRILKLDTICRWAAARAKEIEANKLGQQAMIDNMVQMIKEIARVRGFNITDQTAMNYLSDLTTIGKGTTLSAYLGAIPSSDIGIYTYAIGKAAMVWIQNLMQYSAIEREAIHRCKERVPASPVALPHEEPSWFSQKP